MIPHITRLLELWRIAAHYRLDTLIPAEDIPAKARPIIKLIHIHPAAWSSRERKNPLKLKEALEEMGPLAIKMGQLLSTRRDLIPPELLQQLVLLQDRVKPFGNDVAKMRIQESLKADVNTLFARFDDQPLAAASIFEQRPFDSVNTITEANATLHVDNVIELAKLLLADDVGNIPVQGEYQILQNIQRIIQQAEPDLASQLSPWIGPNLASQIGKIQLAPKLLFKSLDSHLFVAEDFLKEDSGLFAPRWQMDDLNHETRQLTQNIDRLEAKIQQLQSQFSPT